MSKKGDKTKAAIRRTTPALFVQKRFKDATIKDICKATELSRDGLYTRHGSTSQVFVNIISELMSSLKNQVAEKMERDLPAALILDELLERYRSEMFNGSGSLGLTFYEYYSGTSLSEDNAVLKQCYISRTMLRSLTKYDIDEGEFKQANINVVADLLLFSYQGVRTLSSIIPLDDDNISKGTISGIKAMLVK